MRKNAVRTNFRKIPVMVLTTILMGTGSVTGAVPVYADGAAVQAESASQNLVEKDSSSEAESTENASEAKTRITGADVEDGSYPVEVKVTSGTLNISDAALTAENGELTLHLTLKDNTTQDLKIDAMDEEESLGNAKIVVLSSSLPDGALKTTASGAYQPLTYKKIPLKTGKWEVSVSMEGGSGRASVKSPCTLTVNKDGTATAEIEWSSSHYDYMIVGGKKYTPVNHAQSDAESSANGTESEENSRFEIPVAALDEPETVIGDTTAMSRPYEIEYRLTFSSKSARKKADNPKQSDFAEEAGGIIAVVILAVLAALLAGRLKKRKHS